MRVLNNLVIELASAERLTSGDGLTFRNPREGWVFVSCEHNSVRGATLAIDGQARPWKEGGDGASEAMCYLMPGRHTLAVEGRRVRKVVVRTVPELLFTKYGYNPHIAEYGPYDWQFLRTYVHPHVNAIIGSGAAGHRPEIEEWKRQGGKWIIERGLQWGATDTVTADEAFAAWAAEPGIADPALDGILLDEFFSGDNPKYPAWTKAMEQLASDRQFKGKKLYPYCGSHYPDRNDWGVYDGTDRTNSSVPFWRTVFESGHRVAWERYLQERHDEEVARQLIEERIGEKMRTWQAIFPEAQKSMIIALGYMSMGFALNAHPSVDYKVFLDMQFHYLATNRALKGLYGITGWTSGYAEEETLKWTARLYRHYGIEGNAEPLAERFGYTYLLPHIKNPDFAHNWEGWTVPVNIERNCTVRSIEGYSILEGRWSYTAVGNTVMVVRRSADRPNAVSQPIKHLVPGRLYSVKLISGDYAQFVSGSSAQEKHVLTISIEGGELVPDTCFQAVHPNHPTIKFGPFDRNNRFWFNHHHLVFKATAKTGKITISDWKTPTNAGGPVGQELMYNFVEVQPYFPG